MLYDIFCYAFTQCEYSEYFGLLHTLIGSQNYLSVCYLWTIYSEFYFILILKQNLLLKQKLFNINKFWCPVAGQHLLLKSSSYVRPWKQQYKCVSTCLTRFLFKCDFAAAWQPTSQVFLRAVPRAKVGGRASFLLICVQMFCDRRPRWEHWQSVCRAATTNAFVLIGLIWRLSKSTSRW